MTHVLERGLWVAQADETKPVQSYPQNPSNPHHPPAVNFPDRVAPFPVLAGAVPCSRVAKFPVLLEQGNGC